MDAFLWSIWMLVGTAALLWFPGWLLMGHVDPAASPARRRALGLVVGPALVAMPTFALTSATGWFLGPAITVAIAATITIVLLARAENARVEVRRFLTEGRRAADRFPPLLALCTFVYFGIEFDSMYFHALGVNGSILQALGYSLGEGSAALAGNPSLALDHAAPESQVAIPAIFASLFHYPGIRLFFALSFVAFAAIVFHGTLALTGRRKVAVFFATLAAFQPFTMGLNRLDFLVNLTPALWLGALLLLLLDRKTPLWAIGAMLGGLIATRHLFIAAVPLLAILLLRDTTDRGRRARGFALGLTPMLAWVALHHFVRTGPAFVDEGLFPVPLEARGDGSGAWHLNLSIGPAMWRAPYAAFPAWLTLGLATVQRLGTLVVVLAVLGTVLESRKRSRFILATAAMAAPVVGLLLFREPVFLGEQFDRGLIGIVPMLWLAAVGFRSLRELGRWKGLAAFLGLVGLSYGVAEGARALRVVDVELHAELGSRLPRLMPEPPGFLEVERQRATTIGMLPGWGIEHIYDPLMVGAGKRWKDAAREIAHPRFEDRYISLDEKILSWLKGDEFTKQFMPNHPRTNPEAQPRPPGDPYGEEKPRTLVLDLSRTLTESLISVEIDTEVPPEGSFWDLAAERGPLRRDRIRVTPDGPLINLFVFKEYYAPEQVEIAIAAFPVWGATLDGEADLILPDGKLHLTIPGEGFLSYAQVLGERHDRMGLLVALEWHMSLFGERGPEIYGPTRL